MTNTSDTLVARFEAELNDCTSPADAKELHRSYLAEDPVFKAATERRKAYARLKNDWTKQYRDNQDAITHDEVRRWEHGQKVYFGSAFRSSLMTMDCKFIDGHNYEKGDWAYVWDYQPRAHRLWLCKAGKPCTRANVDPIPFSLRDVRDHKISRTELSVRK